MKKVKGISTCKVFDVSRETLKKLLLDFSIDDNGNKITKFKLCKDEKFLKAIKCRKDKISFNTVQCWYKRLANVEPLGVMTDKFIFDYHKNVTKRIGSDVNYYDWTAKKLNKEGRQEYDIKAVLGWDENKRLLALLKLNNSNFNTNKYKDLNLKDLKFIVNMYISKSEINRLEEKLESMVKNGDESVVDLIL